jgi:hypothetical protein
LCDREGQTKNALKACARKEITKEIGGEPKENFSRKRDNQKILLKEIVETP